METFAYANLKEKNSLFQETKNYFSLNGLYIA